MPIARVTVAAVSDEGDTVVVWGRPAAGAGGLVGFAFQAKGDQSDVDAAERASRLAVGTAAVIEYAAIADGWNIATSVTAGEGPPLRRTTACESP